MESKWQPNYLNEIEEILVHSAKYSYEENLRFTYQSNDFNSRMIEYLVVVNIAKNLYNWAWDRFIQVQLEYSVLNFYNGAFPEFCFKTKIRRQSQKSKDLRTGRIDIALTKNPKYLYAYRNPSVKSLVGIEVKSFTKSISTVKKDLIRLSNSLILKDPIGTNSIKACYMIFYRKLDKPNEIVEDERIHELKKKEILKWEHILSSIGNDFMDLNYTLQPIDIKEAALAELLERFDPDITDQREVAENSGLLMCYLIKIKK